MWRIWLKCWNFTPTSFQSISCVLRSDTKPSLPPSQIESTVFHNFIITNVFGHWQLRTRCRKNVTIWIVLQFIWRPFVCQRISFRRQKLNRLVYSFSASMWLSTGRISQCKSQTHCSESTYRKPHLYCHNTLHIQAHSMHHCISIALWWANKRFTAPKMNRNVTCMYVRTCTFFFFLDFFLLDFKQ